MESKKIRYPILDDIRGITLISMIIYHAIWDMVYIYGFSIPWYQTKGAYIWQQSICWVFILLSGFCWPLGHKKWKRGTVVFLAGLLITVVTIVLMPADRVIFGVLTLLGSCMLLLIPFEKLLSICPTIIGSIISPTLFVIFRNVNDGYLGFEEWKLLAVPECLYDNIITTYFGFQAENFYSTDYFSILPWIFLFLTGYFLNRLCLSHHWMDKFKRKGISALEWLGKHSLIIYMLHQPVIYLILQLITG